MMWPLNKRNITILIIENTWQSSPTCWYLTTLIRQRNTGSLCRKTEGLWSQTADADRPQYHSKEEKIFSFDFYNPWSREPQDHGRSAWNGVVRRRLMGGATRCHLDGHCWSQEPATASTERWSWLSTECMFGSWCRGDRSVHTSIVMQVSM